MVFTEEKQVIKLQTGFKKAIQFLEKYKFEYLIIGGIAVGVIGEPRATGDLDVDLLLSKDKINDFLNCAKKEGFKFNINKVTKNVIETGTFNLQYRGVRIDFILLSTEFEKSAFKRKQRLKFLGSYANFPAPEDLILLKVIPGRPLDIFDAERIVIRYRDKLNEKYLLDWAMKLSDEAENMRIYNKVKRLLKT